MGTFLLYIGLFFNHYSFSVAAQNTTNEPIVVTNASHLEQYIGQEIILKGKVSNTKIPTIIGVDVTSFDPDLRGQMAQASGVLKKWVVKEEKKRSLEVARRGPGTYYRLVDPKTGELAKAHPLNHNN